MIRKSMISRIMTTCSVRRCLRPILYFGIVGLVVSAQAVKADAPPPDQYRERIPVKNQAGAGYTNQTAAQTMDSGWKYRLSPGVTLWYFDDEDTETGGALYFDAWDPEYSLNYRVGVEVGHISVDQTGASAFAEQGDRAHLTFVRIPFALEYYQMMGNNFTWYVGGGPDILHTANDLEDTSVGAHAGLRLHYALNDRWGLSVEGGYMWAKMDAPAEDLDLSGAYLTPLLTYTF